MLKTVLFVAATATTADAFSFSPSFTSTFTRSATLSAPALRPATSSRAAARSSLNMAVTRPAQVVAGSPLPRLYVYDHCPFCVRARMIFGMKNIKHEVRFMMNDDKETPTALVGKKIAPILQIEFLKEVMGESMDIVKRIDEDAGMGPSLLKGSPDVLRADIKAWQKKHADTFRELQRPRYVQGGLIPEFCLESARETFITNHQMVGFDKKEWKDDTKYTQEFRKAEYAKAMGKTAELVPMAEAALKELEPLIHSAHACSEGGVSYDDIDLFARLRSVTIVKGLTLPPKVKAYMEHFSEASDIPLYTGLAV